MTLTDARDMLLATHDGRYFAIDKFNTGLAVLVKAEKIGKRTHVDFGLPSGPALFLSVARRSYDKIKSVDPATMFKKWQNGRVPINHSVLFDYFETFASHIVFSFTALEAFANEAIPDGYQYHTLKDGQAIILGRADIERTVNLDEKLHTVLPQALSVTSPKGKHPWAKYKQIKKMRDRIIHLKAVDRSPSGPEQESVWGMMLRAHKEPFCDHAHSVMAHYKPAVNRRWFREYPYATVEKDDLIKD